MDYFLAVQEGRKRTTKAIEVLQEVAGVSSPVLFLKMDAPEWTPVGEEILFAVVEGKGETAAVVLCDGDGNSKAISSWVGASEAESFGKVFQSRGYQRYKGQVRLPI